jgi:hypothetical protein
MKRIVLCAMLLAAPLVAQQTNREQVNKVIMLKTVDPNGIASLFQSWGVVIVPNNQTKTLSILGPADKVAAVEIALKQLDVAPKNLDLIVYFVVGGDQPALEGGAVPQDLRDVIAQLKGTFPFKEYRMLDVLTLRTRAGSMAETAGILNGSTPPKMSKFSIRNATVSEDGTTIRIDRMQAGLKIPFTHRDGASADAKSGAKMQKSYEYIDSMITQDVDVKEGQKVVVGRSSLAGPQQALFLILTAHVIQ